MREVWTAYAKNRRLTGKTCLRGEQECTGKVIVVYHRYDDSETKWIVVPCDDEACDDEGIVLEDIEISTDNEIYAQIAF